MAWWVRPAIRCREAGLCALHTARRLGIDRGYMIRRLGGGFADGRGDVNRARSLAARVRASGICEAYGLPKPETIHEAREVIRRAWRKSQCSKPF